MDIGNAKCPECSRSMTPFACRCTQCGIRIEGDFSVSILAQLSTEEQALVIAFLRSFGSIKKIQEILNVSYPTARARIAGLVSHLDSIMEAPDSSGKNVLDLLDRGEISFDEAMESL